jgi:ribose transport system substrate-binding protein
MPFTEKRYALLGLLLALAVVAAGCGSSSSSSSVESTSAGGSSSEEASGSADLGAAKSAIAPYIGKASPPFPVDEPLKERPSPSLAISQLQFESPYGALFAGLVSEAGKTAGVKVSTVKAGSTASSVQSAAQTILSQSPEEVILPAAEPSTFATQLKEMDEQGIGVFSAGIMEPEKWGIDGAQIENKQVELVGKLLADWTVAKRGDEANVVFYEIPEVSFNSFETEAFMNEMKAICPECEARTSVITATEIGKEAPNTIVSDLQAHPDTNQIVFVSVDPVAGLPAALKAAQIEVGITGFGGDPQSFEYIKNGEMESVLAVGAGVQSWTIMDMALRTAQGMDLTAGEKNGITPMQFLAQKDITFDPNLGWASEPEFVKTFSKLWHVG